MKLTETLLRQIIKEEIQDFLYGKPLTHQLEDLEKLNEYMWLKPKITNLTVDIFVDDGGAYLRYNHSLVLYARNGYGKDVTSFIPFSISPKPKVLDDDMDFNISYDEIFLIQDFIQENLYSLNALANNSITQEIFIQNINAVNTDFTLVGENKTISSLFEMATLKSTDSGLPMDIWLDEGATYQGHAPRIKFRASNEQRTTREFSSMLITKSPTIENIPENSPLRRKDIEKLKKFVINNMTNLLKLANGEIDYLTEFKPNMIID